MRQCLPHGTKSPSSSLRPSRPLTSISSPERGLIFFATHWHQKANVCCHSIPIEQRPPIEACVVRGALYPLDATNKQQASVMITPEGLDGIYNPSFDVTPAELISAIVTEKGVATKGADGQFDLSGIV
jgi:methylthioribose-1-phosphate isomerase